MIVDPDFMDHWRTGMVADAIQDPMAPVYILRLWAHCQERRSDTFVMPTRGLKAQCKVPGDAETFERALIEAGFIERDGDTIKVCGWAEKNAALFAAWENGNKGGRPKKKTQSEPSENPRVTQGEPSANPNGTHSEPIREEKRREEEIQEPSALVDEAAPPPRNPCPTDRIVALYHEHLPMLSRVEVINDARRRSISARWREVIADPDIRKAQDPREAALDFFAWFFGHVATSAFLTGRSKDWRADIDFLMAPTKFARVVEGSYHREGAKA